MIKIEKYLREPINGLTHLAGAILSFIALLAMIIKTTLTDPSVLSITAVTIFGISMILLYATSATYHLVISSDRIINFLQRLDHSMIFLLIAGSYTPFCLIALNNMPGWVLFSIISLSAICGILFKMIWFNCPRKLSTGIYISMGWLALFMIGPLAYVLSIKAILLLILGGILYTVGGFIYALKPTWLEFKHWKHHEIFHIFILLGSLTHFLCVYYYVL